MKRLNESIKNAENVLTERKVGTKETIWKDDKGNDVIEREWDIEESIKKAEKILISGLTDTMAKEADYLGLGGYDFGSGVFDIGQFSSEQIRFINKMVNKEILTKTKEPWQGIINKTVYRFKVD